MTIKRAFGINLLGKDAMDDFQKLVYARLQTLPKGHKISIGGVGDVTNEEALQHVSDGDDVGKLLVAADRHYFNLIKSRGLW